MIVFDTQVLVWRETGDRKLGHQARNLAQRALQEGTAAVSAISFWEVAMRIQKGQLGFDLDIYDWRSDLLEYGLIEIPLDGTIAVRAGLLPDIHGDPADRIIVATALGGHRLLTADEQILAWSGSLDRLDARE